jgi:hypothetical protein
MNIVYRVIFILWLTPHGKNPSIMIHDRVTGLVVSNAIFLQQGEGILCQKQKQVYVISGANGQKVPLRLTGTIRVVLKLPAVMFMKAVVLIVIRIFFLQNFPKQGRMHTFIIRRQKRQTNLIALTVT